MPLASCCSSTVLLEIVSLASAPMLESAQVAMPSSPVLRMSLLVTVELVTPPWKLMPSAVVLRMRMPLKVRPFIGPSIQAPTFMCSIQMFDTVELLIAPPMPLTWALSSRSWTLPKIAKFCRCTLVLADGAELPQKPGAEPVTVEYHIPAPAIVTLLTLMWPGTLNVPGGIHTVPPAPAALIAGLNALVESLTPLASAPWLVTDTEPAGWVSAAPTCSKSAKSIVYEDAVSSESTCSLKVVPAGSGLQ